MNGLLYCSYFDSAYLPGTRSPTRRCRDGRDLSPHRFPATILHVRTYGAYNAGCVYWRNHQTRRRCLADWRDDCLEWLAEEPQADGRFMNQGYLNVWPGR